MENNKAEIKIVADAAQAASTAKGLKQELREATKQAQLLAAQGKNNSDEYANSIKRIAELKDQLKEVNEQVAALDPDKKFQTIAGVASGIAGGFQAAQGAMALFGKESEEVQKALLKVQAATALAQGIDQVREFGKMWGFAKMAIGEGIGQLGKLKTALIATGIGAFTVALGVIVTNWEKIKEAIDKTFPSLGGISNLFDNLKKVAYGALASIVESFKVLGEVIGNVFKGEFGKAVDVAKTFGSRVSKAYTEGYKEEEQAQAKEREMALLGTMIETHQRQLKLLEAQGKDTYAFKKKLIDEELKLLEYQKGKESKEYKDKYLELQLLEIEHQKKLADIRKAAEDKATADYFERLKLEYERQQGLQKIQDDYNKLNEERQNKTLESIKGFSTKRIQIDNEGFNKSQEQRKKRQEEEINDYWANYNAKVEIATSGTQALIGLGNLLITDQAKLEKFNKRAALIQIAVDTAKALSSALATANAPTADNVASGGIAGIAKYITLAGTIITNAARARQILNSSGTSTPPPPTSVNLPKISASGTSAPAPQIGSNTPNGQRVSNQQGEGANEQGQFKVYVLESEITGTQKKVKTIENKSKLF